MGQSKSSEATVVGAAEEIELPKRKITTEFLVGVFTMLGVLALGYQAMGLGGLEFGASDTYEIYAEFDNIAGLKDGSAVEIAGVGIGSVAGIRLKDPEALITLKIKKGIRIRDDDIASIRTKGIIGDRYVKISRGGSDIFIEPLGTVIETESAVDIEDIIGKIVHSMGADDEDEAEE